ncbi:unnamed protein product [Meloidogyne enterolobii]|uniref:Uncharacterized protein n=1 Tax=Meloidogyne enterolobii TaxID=390850 RepID=A0ACB0ZQZ4_MELEN
MNSSPSNTSKKPLFSEKVKNSKNIPPSPPTSLSQLTINNTTNNMPDLISPRPTSSSSSSSSFLSISSRNSSFSKKRQISNFSYENSKNDNKKEINFFKNKMPTTTIINGQHQHYHQKPRQRWRKRRNVFTQKKSLTTNSIKSSSNISPSMLSLSSSSTSLSSSSSGICCSHLSIGSHTAINSSTTNTCWSSSETEVEKNENKGNCNNGKVKVSQQSKIINNENIKNEELEIIKNESEEQNNLKEFGNENEEEIFMLDLSHPGLRQFYFQQRLFFRQIYDQQLAALSARLGLIPPPGDRYSTFPHKHRNNKDFNGYSTTFIKKYFPPPHQHLGYPPAPPIPFQPFNNNFYFNPSCTCCCCLENNKNENENNNTATNLSETKNETPIQYEGK